MAPHFTPPSTTPSSGGPQSPESYAHQQQPPFRVVRKRNRVPLSCGPCRHRKLKCNRAHPCDNCTKRGDVASCSYAAPSARKRSSQSSGSITSPDEMQNRIDRLESLVLSLMTNGAQSAGPAAANAALSDGLRGSYSGGSPDHPYPILEDDEMVKEEQEGSNSEVEGVARSIGVMKMQDNKMFYASDAHWYAILGDIAEVKNYFAEHKKQFNEQMQRVKASKAGEDSPGTGFLLRSVKPADRPELLAAFPDRVTADKLITRYFNSNDPSSHVLHGPTFRRQLEQHWQTPQETQVIWLGLAYAVMTLALQSYHRAGDEPVEYRGKSWKMSGYYKDLTVQCVTLADFTQPVNHMIETLILHLQAEYARSRDAEVGVWIMCGIITRLAMRMGYHRDPAPFTNITPFQGEMRRRVWTFVRMSDLLFSFQVGLPSTVRNSDTDTALPRNLHDHEFGEESKILPLSRPANEVTSISYQIAKARLAFTFGKIVEVAQSITPIHYDEIMKLDQELREAKNMIPSYLVIRSIEASPNDPANLIMQRFNLDLLYNKSQIVLHRRYLSRTGDSNRFKESSRFAYSRQTCLDACLELLAHQATLHHESRPGGRLRSTQWFISSLTTHDFLLAAMMLCLDLYKTAEAETRGQSPSDDPNHVRKEAMYAAIERSLSIWNTLRDHSIEAYKASETLSVMLRKLGYHKAVQQAQQSLAYQMSQGGTLPDDNVAPEHSAAMTLGMLSTGALSANAAYNQHQTAPQAPMSLEAMMNGPGPSGMTPRYEDPQQQAQAMNGFEGTSSPFTGLFGPNMGFQNMDLSGGNIDWDAWETYIQGTNTDISNQLWPAGMDLSGLGGLNDPQHHHQQQQQQQQPQSANLFANPGAFMNANS